MQHIAVHTLIKQKIKLFDRRPNEGREVGPKRWGGIGLPSLSFDRHDSRRRGSFDESTASLSPASRASARARSS